MLEQQVQSKIIKKLTQEGWLVLKVIKLSNNGYPDLLCHREGQTMYIEVKRPKGVLSELQKLRIKELEAKGITVKVWTDYNVDFIWKR
jgi:Holliday junction resolvase